MAHLWSGRFAGDPDAELFDFGASFRFDRRLIDDDIRGSRAWARALAGAGAISAEDARAIDEGLAAIADRAAADPAFVDDRHGDEDVHAFVERELVERVGDAGRRLHTGRSRNEQVALDLRLYVRRRVPLVQRAVAELVKALVDLAGRAGDALMPSYTHLRRAQPVLVAHFLLGHAAALRRDHARLQTVLDECDDVPLGSGAIAGTNYAVDTAALGAALGFSRVSRNSIDVSGDRDFVASFLHAAALGCVHLSRVAEDFILFTSEEFGFFDLSDAAATGSSLMPQKKNPDPLELVRGKSGRVIGRLTGWLATMKSLPSGYSKDLQEDKEALFDAEDTWAACLRAVTGVVSGLQPNAAVSSHAASGLLLATDVADYLVARGVPFRGAHEIVGAIVRRLVEEGRSFEDLSLEEWRSHSEIFGADVRDAISARRSVERKQTPQSTNPRAVEGALREARLWVRAALADA
jgi:argininosuccinate lyase